ncbi:heterokaryon incompatibility protein 6, OR allele [Podospora aff. communis PSN243]|uniref:Heterokaryon incompatibility protein 6, OR allele n=1 Tax=Podospora aff. communis PSN243 TaxID=3040156 RepID=A0AAV9GB94_9PEZI|nr:heterokaryon incompatibility protein 6, OR allele [Podospora aff. communis PSN243]
MASRSLNPRTPQRVYWPLDRGQDSIRLVQISRPDPQLGDPSADTLVCRLVHVTFGQRPRYYALSYMWGSDALPKKTIILEGIPFTVGQNLFDALQFLRNHDCSSESSAYYWIDAICINQHDIAERNLQLQLMPHIYRRATTVLIWLGHPRPREFPQDLIENSYWERLWIVQEVTLASRLVVCYGSTAVDWQSFIDWVTSFRPPRISTDFSTPGPLNLDEQRRDMHRLTLEDLLWKHRHA